MAFTKNIEREITVQDDGLIYVKRTTTIFENGVESGVKLARFSFEPGADVSGEAPRVRNIAGVVWTQAVIDAYAAKKAAAIAATLANQIP